MIVYRTWLAVFAIGLGICAATPGAGASTTLSCADVDPEASADILFSRAMDAVQRDDLVCARALYDRLVLEHPHNVDYTFGYAQVLHWSGAHVEALRLLVLSRALSPDYEDVWRLEAQVRLRLIESGDASELADFLDEANTRFDNPAWTQDFAPKKPPRFRWLVSATRDYLDSDAPDWQRYDLLFGAFLNDNAEINLSATSSERFELVDYQTGIGVRLSIRDLWSIDSGIKYASSPTHLPELEMWLGAMRSFRNAWVGHLRLASRRYSDESLQLTTIAAEKYAGAFRVEYALGISNFGSEVGLGHRLSVDHYLASGARLGFIAAFGEEFETLGLGQLLRTDTTSAVFIAGIPFSDRLELGLNLGIHNHGDFYRRIMLGVSASGAF